MNSLVARASRLFRPAVFPSFRAFGADDEQGVSDVACGTRDALLSLTPLPGMAGIRIVVTRICSRVTWAVSTVAWAVIRVA